MRGLAADVRFSWRALRKRQGMSLLLIGTLAVGLAANATIYSLFDALLVRPLPFAGLPHLARLWETSPTADPYDRSNVAPANFFDWQAATGGVFSQLIPAQAWDANLRGREVPERVIGFKVAPSFFDLLGIRPSAGRVLQAGDDRPGEDHRLVLGHDLWERSFGGDPTLLGHSLVLDGEAYTVVGIAPPGFRFPEAAEVWAPLIPPAPGQAARDAHDWTVYGRLSEGHSIGEAQAVLSAVASRLEREHPETNAKRGVAVTSLARGAEDPVMRPLVALWQTAALFVLLIACVNAANLMLARSGERGRELAVRTALGASRRATMRLVLTEGLLIAAAAALVSLPLTELATDAIRRSLPAELAVYVAGWASLGVNSRVALLSALLALVVGLLSSGVPAWRASRGGHFEDLKDGGRSGTAGPGRQRMRSLLVTAQVAAALMLMIGAGLSVGAARRFLVGPQGYDTKGLLTLEMTLSPGRYPTPSGRIEFARRAGERLSELPSVRRIAFANLLPGRGTGSSRMIEVEGRTLPPGSEPEVEARNVSTSYFETLGIPVLEGRRLAESDRGDEPQVAVVSASLAARYWPGRSALGNRFRVTGEANPWITIVGVSGDVIHDWFGRSNYPTYYRPYAQNPTREVAFALRVDREPESLVRSVRLALSEVDPEQPAQRIESMTHSISRSTFGLQFVAGIMSSFGALGCLLALTGVYGLIAYRVSLQTREVGVRIALGATRSDILHLTLGKALRFTGAGLVIGCALAAALGRALAAALSGAIRLEASTFLFVTVLLTLAAAGAAYVPARRALAVDPAIALRAE